MNTVASPPKWSVFIGCAEPDMWLAATRVVPAIIGCGASVSYEEIFGRDTELRALGDADEVLLLLSRAPGSLNRPTLWQAIGAVSGRKLPLSALLFDLKSDELAANPEVPGLLKPGGMLLKPGRVYVGDDGLTHYLRAMMRRRNAAARRSPRPVATAAPPASLLTPAVSPPPAEARLRRVLLCFDRADQTAVEDVAKQLRERDLVPELCAWERGPGRSWKPATRKRSDRFDAATVLVGASGFGPWWIEDLDVFLRDLTEIWKRPVILVELRDGGIPVTVRLPVYLEGQTQIDLRTARDPIAPLVRAINGYREVSPAQEVLAGARAGNLPAPKPTLRSLKVFLSHASEDKPTARDLYDRLREAGGDPWLDKKNLRVGELWKKEIRQTVRQCHAMIVCLSPRSVTKVGVFRWEIKLALDEADGMPPERRFVIIPLRLEECKIPKRLGDRHCIDWFDVGGADRLIDDLTHHVGRLGLPEGN